VLKPKSPQESFCGNYLYEHIVPVDHLLRKINQVIDKEPDQRDKSKPENEADMT
jgi:hypothetical protein